MEDALCYSNLLNASIWFFGHIWYFPSIPSASLLASLDIFPRGPFKGFWAPMYVLSINILIHSNIITNRPDFRPCRCWSACTYAQPDRPSATTLAMAPRNIVRFWSAISCRIFSKNGEMDRAWLQLIDKNYVSATL